MTEFSLMYSMELNLLSTVYRDLEAFCVLVIESRHSKVLTIDSLHL